MHFKGQFFMAINPAFFEDGFEGRLQDLMDFCRNMEPVTNNIKKKKSFE
jgi:LDH2 family malate/lactate/ureidoglycolate dehydrogenase